MIYMYVNIYMYAQIFRHRWFDLETSGDTHVRGRKEMPQNFNAREELLMLLQCLVFSVCI